MTSTSLARLFKRSPELQAAFKGLLLQMGEDAAIFNADKKILAVSTDSAAPDRALHPIEQSGEIIGWVTDGAAAHSISAILEYILQQEEEKKALGTELIERYRELNLFYHLSEHLVASPHPASIINVALDEALRLNKAKAGLILTSSGEGSPLQIAAVHGFAYHSIRSGPLLQQVIQTRKADIANDVHGDDYFLEEEGQILSMACAPIQSEQRVQGFIVLVRDQGSTFSAASIKLLNSIAMQIAPILETIRLYQVQIKNERIEHELMMARQVQESLLPTQMPQIPGWDFARLWRPAREVSGDFYDMIDEGSGQLGLVIADVTDKGMPASLFMAFARTALRASIGHSETPAEAVREANNLICQDSFESLFATLFYARLDTGSGQLTYVNGGHNPPMLYQSRLDEIDLLKRTGLPLGVEPESVYEERSVTMQPGDFILFYTDGITEAVNPEIKEFGMERLQQVLYTLRDCSSEEILAGLEHSLDEYADPTQAFDDITLMAARRL